MQVRHLAIALSLAAGAGVSSASAEEYVVTLEGANFRYNGQSNDNIDLTIQPGDSYSYASGCPLGTPSGAMVGGYSMVDDRGRMFEVAIPAFSLDVPGERRVLN